MKKTVTSLSLVDPAKVKKDDRISKMAQQLILGGYGIDLPEVVVTCGEYWGQCWKCDTLIDIDLGPFGQLYVECRKITGSMSDSCYAEHICLD